VLLIHFFGFYTGLRWINVVYLNTECRRSSTVTGTVIAVSHIEENDFMTSNVIRSNGITTK